MPHPCAFPSHRPYRNGSAVPTINQLVADTISILVFFQRGSLSFSTVNVESGRPQGNHGMAVPSTDQGVCSGPGVLGAGPSVGGARTRPVHSQCRV